MNRQPISPLQMMVVRTVILHFPLDFFRKVKVILSISILFVAAPIFSQEICDNGIDDNGDGIVDINDPNCNCLGITLTEDVTSFLPNPSFEEMNCCPFGHSQLECASSWQSGTTGTADYLHTCDFIFDGAIAAGITPFPDGDGIAGFLITETYKEYVASCLLQPLVAGNTYSLEFQIASSPFGIWGDECNNGVIYYPAIDISIFGNVSCGILPLATFDCPTAADPAWVSIGSVSYSPSTEWNLYTITVTPSTTIYGFMIGSPCDVPPGYGGGAPCYPYFYLDGLTLVEQAPVEELFIDVQGHPCDDNLELIAGEGTPDGTWQWYLNGIALVGEINNTLQIPLASYEPGVYTIQFSQNGGCLRDSIVLSWEVPEPTVEEYLVCPGELVHCAGQEFVEAGEFDVTLSSYAGCDSLVTCRIISYPEVPLTIVNAVVCDSEKVEVCGTEFGQSGIFTTVCNSVFGCDSLVELHLNVLDPKAVINASGQLGCDTTTVVVLDGSATPENPIPYGTTTYFWSGPNNGIIGNVNDEKVQIELPGIYCLEVTFSSGGTICSHTDCVQIDQSFELPSVPEIAGPNVACTGDHILLNGLPSDSSSILDFHWIVPPEIAIVADQGSSILLDATMPGSWDICLILENYCGSSDSICHPINFSPQDILKVTTSTCDPAQAGLDTLFLTNQYGCDSTLYIERIYSGNYQETNLTKICGAGVNYTDTVLVTTGPCDSLFITNYQFISLDTTWLSATTCNPSQAGVTIAVQSTSMGCDSTIITSTSLSPSDSTLVSGVTCDPGGAIFNVSVLSNQYGCDSVVTTDIMYVAIDTLYVEKTTCEPTQVGTIVSVLPGVDCDTVLVTETAYVPFTQSEETIILCGQSGVLSDTSYLQNSTGCDSLAIRYYEYVSLASQFTIQGETCAGDQDGRIEIINISGGQSPFELQLNSGGWQSATVFNDLSPGQYTILIRDAAECLDTLMGLVITPGATITIDAGPDRIAAPGEVIDLSAQTTLSLSQVQWTATDPLACPTCLQTTLGPLTTNQTVNVTGWTPEGCSDSDALEVLVKPQITVFIPNSFTPNGDGINDVFSVYGNDQVVQVRNLAIYDRWGNALYSRSDLQINDPSAGWDGTFRDEVMDPGVYIYVVEVELLNGDIRLYKGDVTLTR